MPAVCDTGGSAPPAVSKADSSQSLDLQAAQRSGNVSATCRRYDVSRTVFYRWRARLTRYGADGLHPTRRTARRGRAPELTVTDERRVIAEALAWPTRGPQWVSDRLARQGRVIAPVTVWRVLRRVGLNHRLARLAVLEDQGAATGLLTERTVRRRRGRHVAAARPGDLCSLDSFYIWKITVDSEDRARRTGERANPWPDRAGPRRRCVRALCRGRRRRANAAGRGAQRTYERAIKEPVMLRKQDLAAIAQELVIKLPA